MPRPTVGDELRKAIREYLATAEVLSPEEAPLNTSAVALRLGYNRKTLKKYSLDIEIAQAAERQAFRQELAPQRLGRKSQADLLQQRDAEIMAMRQRCEALIAYVCVAEGNAQRLGIDPGELWRPLPVPDRSVAPGGANAKPMRRTIFL